MEAKQALGERLKNFIHSCYGSNKEFSIEIKLHDSYLSKYISAVYSPTTDIFLKFYQAGINICWLISGEGSMFAGNKKGQELRIKYNEKNPGYGIEMMKTRVSNWIIENYTTLSDFANEMDVKLQNIEDELADYSSASPMFLTLIEKSGCNIDWAISGKGNVYANNPRGFIFQYKKEGKEMINDDFLEDGADPQLMIFYDLMRKAVRDEINQIEKEEDEIYNEI